MLVVSNHVRSDNFNNSFLAVLCLCKHFDLGRVGLIYSPFSFSYSVHIFGVFMLCLTL